MHVQETPSGQLHRDQYRDAAASGREYQRVIKALSVGEGSRQSECYAAPRTGPYPTGRLEFAVGYRVQGQGP
ncbi:hypothetical protein Y032_0003g1307 [Ancylostoma ceylanicum]|uniref:Uncharacterized protein n=1 Tax=Ancylostoma ceylanicum TaxID=53326 RepID=A0A016VWD4_9BILA|nr:hypothetical protein Y032_0003g1307 [Ancylostoma ceylanicum]